MNELSVDGESKPSDPAIPSANLGQTPLGPPATDGGAATRIPAKARDRSHGCGGCVSRWTGLRAGHCAECHRTFSGITAFDAHRSYDHCKDPAAVGLVDRAGIWGRPGDDTRWGQ